MPVFRREKLSRRHGRFGDAKHLKRRSTSTRMHSVEVGVSIPLGTMAWLRQRNLLSSKFAPTAVFCVSDHEAKFVYSAAEQLGLSIPADVSVIGFNDLDFSEMLQPTLTTMHLDAELMGRQVAKMVVGRLDDMNHDLSVVKVDATLMERNSVAAPNPNR